MAKTINGEVQLHAQVDSKEIIITESSVRRDLQLADEEGIDCLPNSIIFEQFALMGWWSQVPKTIGDTTAQTRFESVSKHSNDSLLARSNTLQSDEDRLKLDELMKLYTNLQNRVLDLEKTKTTQRNEIDSLKRRVKKLERRNRSRTHKRKRLYKVGLSARVESSGDEESLGEDASKQDRWIDADDEITLVNDADNEMFDVDDLGKSTTTTTTTTSSQQSHDKGKGIMIEKHVKHKKKDQIRLDGEAALKLQDEFDEEERIARERAEKEQEANIALIETWDDIQAKIDADHQKHFAAKRAEEKRNKSPTKAQQRKIMCTYIKNMEGYKLKDLKLKEFDRIQEMFDREFRRVNTFEDFRPELGKGEEKRAEEELEQEITKKQKVDHDKKKAELKQLTKTIPDEEKVAIDAIHLAVKSPRIVDWKIHKEDKSYYQTVRADGKSEMYMIFSQIDRLLQG
nr:hypothetical protein [Tanacetum cinerariifolium]